MPRNRARSWSRRPLRQPRLVGALLAATVLAAGCSGADGASDSDGDGKPRPGGTLTVAAEADPACLDPQQTGQIAALDVVRSVVDTLTDQDPKTGEIVPWLAKSFKVEDGARAFTFQLRSGVTFSDGAPLDAAAVKKTFDELVKLPANSAPAYVQGYQGTEVAGKHKLTVRFKEPNAQFLQATSGTGLGIFSPATFKNSLAERCRGKFTGSGPYVLDHYTANQEVVIKKRGGYRWPSSTARTRGGAQLDKVKFVFIPEAGARSGALSSGQVQVAKNVQATDQDQFEGNGFRLLSQRAPGLIPPLSLNHQGILADQKVRRALSLGIDREKLVETVFNDRYKPATSILASTTPFYTDVRELIRFDRAEARQLLESAGWKLPKGGKKDGIRVKDGKPLRLNWLIPAPMPTHNEFVQQELRKIGVDVQLKSAAPAAYVEQQQAGKFDITAVAVTRADPDVLRNIFYSKGANLWHLPAGTLDTYLEQQVTAATDKERQRAVDKAVRLILQRADTVPLYESALVHGASEKVKNLGLDASTRFNFHDTWLG